MQSDKPNEGPACSINSRPQEENKIPVDSRGTKNLTVLQLTGLIQSKDQAVVIIDAEWCGDCKNQMRNLGPFKESLNAAGIAVYVFTAEGPNYDQFVSPEHKTLAMRIYSTPLGGKIFDEHTVAEDSTSVMAKRKREGYPAIFFIKDSSVQFWSVEDTTAGELQIAANTILERAKL